MLNEVVQSKGSRLDRIPASGVVVFYFMLPREIMVEVPDSDYIPNNATGGAPYRESRKQSAYLGRVKVKSRRELVIKPLKVSSVVKLDVFFGRYPG